MGRLPPSIIDRVDALHYESRALRSELRRSNERLVVARATTPKDLTPHQPSMLEQDWIPPGQPVDVESVSGPACACMGAVLSCNMHDACPPCTTQSCTCRKAVPAVAAAAHTVFEGCTNSYAVYAGEHRTFRRPIL